MKKSTENLQKEKTVESGFMEELTSSIIKAYQESFNNNNEKNEIKFILTVTTHKVTTESGNKHCAYLRLDRSIRPKGYKEQMIDKDGKQVLDDGWEGKLIHQEAHVFRNIQEMLNPDSPWREQLFTNCIARLVGAGLEYAELLKRIQQQENAKKLAGLPTDEEERMAKLNLVSAKEMPKPLTKADEEYKEWLAKERQKEGL